MNIRVITTGGTIGAMAYENPAQPPEFSMMPAADRDFVAEALALPDFGFCKTCCLALEPRDSKDIDSVYLENMIATINAGTETRILITHGTDRILNSADYLYRRGKTDTVLATKTIILTGAMIPLANGPQSDGYQNLRFSLETLAAPARLTIGGVYIVLSADRSGVWQPMLYPFKPDFYEKAYATDGRYHHLRQKA